MTNRDHVATLDTADTVDMVDTNTVDPTAEKPAPRKRTTRAAKSPTPALDATETQTTIAEQAEPAKQPVRRGPRVSRPRTAPATEATEAMEATDASEIAAPAKATRATRATRTTRTTRAAKATAADAGADNTDATVTVADTAGDGEAMPAKGARATKTTGARKTRRAASAEAETAPEPVESIEPVVSVAPPAGDTHPTSAAQASATSAPGSSFAAEPYQPAARSSYRFGRANQETGSAEPSTGEPAHRPLRRADRSGWNGQNGQNGQHAQEPAARSARERVQPHVPGGSDATRTPRQPAQPAGGPNAPRSPNYPGGHPEQQRGHQPPQAPGRGSAPYSPGGRSGQQHPQQPPVPGYDIPYPPNTQQGGPNAPYGGYPPYEPYLYDPRDPRAPQDRSGQTGRPLRGRSNYPPQPGTYDPRDPRMQRQPARPPSPADYYRREQGLANQRERGLTPTRNVPGAHAPHDRRGVPAGPGGTRGPAGGRPTREPGYPTSLYTPVPGAPGLIQQLPNERPDRNDRYAPSAGATGARPAAAPATLARTVEVAGIVWQNGGNYSPADLLDGRTLQPIARINADDLRRMGLRQGDKIAARAEDRAGRRYVVAVESINDRAPETAFERPSFDKLTASFPDRRIRLEHGAQPISVRIIDLFAPLGFGSRALVVAPPKTGKTTLMREAAEAVLTGYPDAVVMAVLVGERPEEVTDLRARLEPRGGLVYAASFDEDTQRHAWLVQVAVEQAKRVAESGRDAFMVLDSLTRLARAENLSTRGQGRTLSGGIDAQALDTGRRAFGAARNLEEGGSLTILATCLVDTGSRQDDVVYEEFKGTGNMELHLSRELAQRRLFPAVDAVKSSTRREEMLLTPEELRASTALRRRLADLPPAQATQQLLSVMERTPSNAALLQAIEQSGWISSVR